MTHVTHVSACCAIPSRLRFNVGAPGLCLTAHSTVVAGQRIRDAPHLWQGPRGAFCRRSSVVPVRTMPHPVPCWCCASRSCGQRRATNNADTARAGAVPANRGFVVLPGELIGSDVVVGIESAALWQMNRGLPVTCSGAAPNGRTD